jgi:hypothetical protein
MPGQMSQMITERPNAGAVRHQDRCGIVRRKGGGGFASIVAHGITPVDVAVESQEYPHGVRLHQSHSLRSRARRLVGSVFRTKVPGIRALLCKSSLSLKLQGGIRSTLVSPVLSFD